MADLRTYKGDNFEVLMEIVALVDEVETAVNITGYTCFFTAKRTTLDADANALIRKTWTVHTDPAAGQTTITLAPADTATVGAYEYDFGYVTTDDKKKTLVRGKLFIEQNVTNTVE